MSYSVYHISTFNPTACGIATYAEDLINSLNKISSFQARLQYEYEETLSQFSFNIIITKKESYLDAANAINNSQASIVSIQHEFGIFGGEYGEYITYLFEFIVVRQKSGIKNYRFD